MRVFLVILLVVVAGYLLPKNVIDRRVVREARPTLAIVVQGSVERDDYPELRSRVLFCISSATGNDEFEVVVLNKASACMRYNVIKHSQVVYCSCLRERVKFEELAIMDHLDFQMTQEYARRYGTEC